MGGGDVAERERQMCSEVSARYPGRGACGTAKGRGDRTWTGPSGGTARKFEANFGGAVTTFEELSPDSGGVESVGWGKLGRR